MAALAAAALAFAIASAAGQGATRVRPLNSTGCGDPFSSHRDASNPLMLGSAPGSNPLHGASFFVDGPAHGAAAGAIAQLLGYDTNQPPGHFLPSFPDSESWQTFYNTTVVPGMSSHPQVAGQVRLLSKIASEPEVQRVSAYTEGGKVSGISDFMRKLFCHNFTADAYPTIPILLTYFAHPDVKSCTARAIRAAMPKFKSQIDAVAAGTGNRPAVYLLELDAIGSSRCYQKAGGLGAWEAMLRYEVDKMAALPHAVVYVEAGYSDANPVGYTAKVLNAIHVRKIRGFFTNDTHNAWTINEVHWAEKISKKTHGAHYIVNTAQNGNGPKLNPHPVKQGIEDLCNPPGLALGPPDTTNTGFPHADAFMWVHIPGESDGHCNGGPTNGTFWPAYAEGLAARANAKLGPGYPSKPF